MHQNDVMSALKENLPVLRSRYGVRNLSVFGSVARGEERPDSDVDILVEFEQTPNFDQFMDLKFYLEELLQTKVDLVTRHALKPRMRPFIEKEALLVA
jgi:predicted nucleotidyltransferase